MKVKIIETIETIWEIPDDFYDDKDYVEDIENPTENLSYCEIASDFKTGKKLYENVEDVEISWDTKVFNYETDKWEEVSDGYVSS